MSYPKGMTTYHGNKNTPASTAQLTFITNLLTQRVVPQGVRENIWELMEIMTSKDASETIDKLKAMPFPAPAETYTDIQTLIKTLPNANYALPVKGLGLTKTGTANNDLIFVAVKTYKGVTYLRRLHGSVGSFVRKRIDPADSLIIVKAIAENPLAAVQAFGKAYSRCGKCGAELTDEDSRAHNLGPVCRKAFGL
jgi:hypothetical protein